MRNARTVQHLLPIILLALGFLELGALIPVAFDTLDVGGTAAMLGPSAFLPVALGVVWALRRPVPLQWRIFAPLQGLGQMSYSVFLVHFPVCLLVNALVSQLWPQEPVLNALGMLLAFGLSIGAGRTLYWRVERHLPSWTLALRWQAGLVGTGLLVALADSWI